MSPERRETGRKFSLKGLLRRGAWVAADNWSQQILQFVSFLYIGNIIGPTAIGQMTVALTYMLLMHALLMNAFTDSIIQREELLREHEDAVFWTSASLGLLAMLITIPLAPQIARSFGEPQIAPLIMAISPVCLAMGLISFFEARIRRELRFASLAGRSIASVGTAFVVAVIFAYRGYGVWSLIAFQLVWRGVELVFVATVARWRPKGMISLPHLVDLLDYSLHNIGVRLIDFFAQNAGRIFVGYFFGMNALGLYQLARRFVEAPLNAASGVTQGIMLPILARLQDDKRELNRAVAQTVQAVSFLLLPAFTGLLLVAPDLVDVLLEPAWKPAGELVQLLAMAGLFIAFSYFYGIALLALGRASLTFFVSAALLLGRLVLYAALATYFGLVGLVIAEVCLAAIGLLVWFMLFERETGSVAVNMLAKLALPLGATVAMAVAVEGFRFAAQAYLSPVLMLIGMIVTGLVSFGAVVALTGASEIVRAVKMLRASR